MSADRPFDARQSDESAALPPLAGGILVGGASRRMGAPKALLDWQGVTFLERIAAVLAEVAPEIVLFGGSPGLPHSLERYARVADAAEAQGPLAGLLAAFDWRPEAAWLMLSCDQPLLSVAALEWLVGERRPARMAVLPQLAPGRIEPFPGVYEPSCRPALRALAVAGGGKGGSLQPLAGLAATHVAAVPPRLAGEFLGANSPEELAVLRARAGKPPR